MSCEHWTLGTGQGSSTDTRYTQEGAEVSVPPKYWLGHRIVEGKEPPPQIIVIIVIVIVVITIIIIVRNLAI